MKTINSVLSYLIFVLPLTVFSQSEIPLDPDSKKAKGLFTEKYESLKIPSEQILIKGGSFNGEKIEAFYLDKTLVTVEQYEACVIAGVCPSPPDNGNWAATYNRRGNKKRPVNEITWYGAKAYCDWMGKRLPSADEWEWAARGREEDRVYPWGNEIKLTIHPVCWQRYDSKFDTGQGTCEVGKYARSRDGVTDMAGNVWEWTSTFSDEFSNLVIMKGGAWYNDDPEKLKVSYRGYASPYHSDDASDGFRCAFNQ